jgi:hypothetical protein
MADAVRAQAHALGLGHALEELSDIWGHLMSKWYVTLEGRARGPVPIDIVLDYLKTRDRAAVYVWREGFDDWRLAKDVAELAGAGPPPLPLIAARHDGQVLPAPDAKAQRKPRKARWFKVGAIIGLIYAIVGIVAGRPSQQDAFFLAGYILGGVGFLGLFGFIAGLIADLTHRPVKTPSIAPPGGNVSAPSRHRNFIVRHWRGELPLWVSYWAINLLGNLCAVVAAILIAAVFGSQTGYHPLSIFATFTMIWACVLLLASWQLVGTWRSAKHYSSTRRQQGRSAVWGVLAQTAVIFGVFTIVSTIVRDGVPQIVESWRIAFLNDPDIPEYSIRVMRDGTEAEIDGGFKYGLADDFVKILSASRQVKVVHLNSIGGRLGEGKKLSEIIRGRGLTTYVSSKCMSACTLAFAGGRQRYLRNGAILGFHKGAFPGIDDEGDDLQRAIFIEAGFDAAFIAKALSTSNRDMYKPGADVLLAAHVITGTTDGKQFAISGLGTELSKEDIALSLAKTSPLFQAMKERFPRSYDSLVEEYHQGLMQEKSEVETIQNTRAKFLPFIRRLIPLADDDVLVDYARILVDQYEALNKRDPTACYQYASGTGNSSQLWQTMTSELKSRELAIQERVIRTAAKRPTIDQNVQEALWDKVRMRLKSRGVTESDLQTLGEERIDKSKHPLYCALSMAMYQEIARMPQREAATLVRTAFLDE